MKCEYCNNEIPHNVTTCPACGAPAPVASAPSAPAPVVQPAVVSAPVVQPSVVSTPVAYASPIQPSVVVLNPALQQGQSTFAYPYPPKSRLTYILLAVFIGWLGAHNFYAKRTGSGITQLLLTVLSCGILAPISEIWCFIEIFAVDKDGNNVPFK